MLRRRDFIALGGSAALLLAGQGEARGGRSRDVAGNRIDMRSTSRQGHSDYEESVRELSI